MDRNVLRSRLIRECILKLLARVFRASPDVAVEWRQIMDGFMTSRLRYDRSDVEPELADLVEDGLIERVDVPGDDGGPVAAYRITSRGRDFVRAHFPWARIDEFSGDQRIV